MGFCQCFGYGYRQTLQISLPEGLDPFLSSYLYVSGPPESPNPALASEDRWGKVKLVLVLVAGTILERRVRPSGLSWTIKCFPSRIIVYMMVLSIKCCKASLTF